MGVVKRRNPSFFFPNQTESAVLGKPHLLIVITAFAGINQTNPASNDASPSAKTELSLPLRGAKRRGKLTAEY
jgi:hypothetical protein